MSQTPSTRRDRRTPKEQRQDAFKAVHAFSQWLHLGTQGPVPALSPARALEHLDSQDVQDLLGAQKVAELRKAARSLM